MKRITLADLGWIPALILATVTTGLILWPIVAYTEHADFELVNHPPDWLPITIAILIMGFCFFLTRVYIGLFARLFRPKQ